MDLKDFIKGELDRIKTATTRAVEGLNYHETMWRPGPECNSMGLILFHQTRSEDVFVQSRILGKPQVWEAEGWYKKFSLPVGESGSGYTAEQLDNFRPPELKDLLEYAEAVRKRTLDYLAGMTNEEFDKVLDLPRFGKMTIGALFMLIVVHLAQHSGELLYLRGVQRGMNK